MPDDESYEMIMGFPPTRLAAQRTPEERRASLERFFAMMEALPEDEFSESFMRERPLNISILEDGNPGRRSEPLA
jgi:hypothetical protein